MKKTLFILTIILFPFAIQAQNLYLRMEGRNSIETFVIDSVTYSKKHENAKSVADEAARISTELLKLGYLESELADQRKENDSTFYYLFSVGRKTSGIRIYTGKLTSEQKNLLNIYKDTIIMPLSGIENFMNSSISILEKKGFSLSSMQLTDYTPTGPALTATLNLKTERKRTLDGLIIEGYTAFPEGIRKNILKKYRGKTFNQQNLERVYNDFNAVRFVSQMRYPEILFKKDTTKVYVYLEKAKANSFDGFIGFANDDTNSKIFFTGYVDLILNNVLNSGERFNLYWKSDGNKQTTFNAGLEIPYMFGSPLGVKALLRIFKQDSTFQNTVTDVNLGYYFRYNTRLYLGHQQTKSVDIQNLNSTVLSDYSNTFWTTTFEHTEFNPDEFLFPEQTTLILKGGAGKRSAQTGNTNQYFIQLNASHNFYLNRKNIINLKSQNYYLNSNTYIINELYRFGGINSIRGFNENSLQANLFAGLMAEYRYLLAPNIYVHSITDYGYFQDETSKLRGNLLGLGLGFGILTKTGLFNLIYANGSTGNQQIKLSNSIVHISFKTSF